METSARKLPDLLNGYIQYQENTEPPNIYKKWCGVSLLAAALQRKVHLQWGTLRFYPNLYIILVGPPGKARKGTAMKPLRNHLTHLKVALASESTTREALIQRLEEAATISQGDTKTFDMEPHSSLTVCSDELTSLIGYNNKELMANLADWFDCADSWTYRTKTSGTNEITNLFLNILAATTPELIQATMPFDMIGGGLSSRMLFIYAKSKGKRVSYPGMTPEQDTICKHVSHDLEQLYKMQGVFKVSEDFMAIWDTWYMQKPEGNPLKSRFLDYYWERREVHLIKLSLIMSASRSNEMVIRACDFNRANEWLTEAECFMPYAFQGMGHRDDAVTISGVMNMIADIGEVTIEMLLNAFYADVTLEQLKGILVVLETRKWCTLTKDGGPNWRIKYKGTSDG